MVLQEYQHGYYMETFLRPEGMMPEFLKMKMGELKEQFDPSSITVKELGIMHINGQPHQRVIVTAGEVPKEQWR